jgi:putative transposase
MDWLFEARKRFGLKVLNYIVTSNHIHLLVMDDISGRNVIPDSIQLIAGRTGQEFNRRKNRKGAFWEDRYHATAVQCGGHLIQCMTYIDLNMVRAGVVKHPSEWEFSGYHEIQNPRRRYRIIDHETIMSLFELSDLDHLKSVHHQWVIDAMKHSHMTRQEQWTGSIAVGDKVFLETMKEGLKNSIKGRKIVEVESGVFQLREAQAGYGEGNRP